MTFQKEVTEQRFCNIAKDSVRVRKVVIGFDDDEVSRFTSEMDPYDKQLKGSMLSRAQVREAVR